MPDILAELVLVDQMPITYNALVVEYTSKCNAHCAMCYQSAGPKGSDTLGKATLSVDDIERVIRQAGKIETIERRFHITGGEAYLDIDALLYLINVARREGFFELTTTTNAYWARDKARAVAICHRSRRAGMTSMEISWDYWHAPYMDPDVVSNCLEACLATGIESNLRLLSSKSHSYQEALEMLRPEALESATRISCAPVFPTGRAEFEVGVEDTFRQGSLDDACHGMLNLTVNARGNVSPCCAGLDQTPEYVFGNIKRQDLGDIVAGLNRSPLARALVFRGVRSVARMIEEAGGTVGSDFQGICHLCWSIFSHPEQIQKLEQALEQRSRAAIRHAVDRLKEQMPNECLSSR